MLYTAADMTVYDLLFERREIQIGPNMVHCIGEVAPGIRQSPIQVEHHEVDLFFHYAVGLKIDSHKHPVNLPE